MFTYPLSQMNGHKIHPGLDDSTQPSGDVSQAAREQVQTLSSVLRSYRSLKGLGLLLMSILFVGFGFVTIELTFP